MTEIRFSIRGVAVPWARAGRFGSRSFTPTKQKNYMAMIKAECADAMNTPPLEGPVSYELIAVFPRPKSHSRKRREAVGGAWKDTKPDADNLSKIIKDAVEGIAYINDSQIADTRSRKLWGDEPGITVVIRSLEGVAP
ncbi:MAG: RusA family crossover junction endodeoxyribonuclease [Pseudomonadota bacterium]